MEPDALTKEWFCETVDESQRETMPTAHRVLQLEGKIRNVTIR